MKRHRTFSSWGKHPVERAMADRKIARRAPAAPSPANWETMTEAERQAWREEQQRIEDMAEWDNPLLAG